ncbi:hypothetical protein JCM19231_5335 [Vibrio ishigakensis]|uniref:Uncharacterized protein n=1 Tax=Vibrio ishigakensis TaxID=1481914 RepID=A0A0B8NNG9_9VIBR|nr:hypothetical protein JCM19231_5335 [Vibrio ishigakensis]
MNVFDQQAYVVKINDEVVDYTIYESGTFAIPLKQGLSDITVTLEVDR